MTKETAGTPSTPPPKPSLMRPFFFGADGLRAGWSLILFLFLTVVIGKVTTFLLHAVPLYGHGGHAPQPDTNPLDAWQVIIIRFGIFLDLAIATWIMSRIERRPLAVYGSGGPRKTWCFAAGCFSGVICFSALAGCLWAMGFLVFDGTLLRGPAILRWGAIWAIAFLMVALAEETSLRAYMQFTLTRGLAGLYGSWFKAKHRRTFGFWTAAGILSCLFVSNHSGNPGESRLGLAQLGLRAADVFLALAHRVAVVGDRLPRGVRLGGGFPVRRGRQWLDHQRTLDRISSIRKPAAQRRVSRGRGKCAGNSSLCARRRPPGLHNLEIPLADRQAAS